jgi:aspartyl-tRNA(Asn)/glutamyl-tRNA(Gln) amidotransferase subunit A
MTDLCDLRGHDLARLFSAGEATPTEALESCLRRVEAVDDRVKAFLEVTADVGRQQAREVEELLKVNEPVAGVAGVPLGLKDVLCTRGITTTCGSQILHNYIPPYDCTPWERLKAGGSVLVGKTNCDEFAMGSSTENSSFFPTRNPWDLDSVPGGSSGGSAAAVAAGEVVWALGTDTGGSVRQPAALCGVVGLKPTYGLISRYGLIAFASSLDTVGTFTRDVRDCATLLSAIAGRDAMDATCLPEEPRDYTEGLDGGVDGLRIGVVRDWLGEGLEPEVRRAVGEAIDRLEGLGARV